MRQALRIDVSWATIGRVLATLILVWLWLRLWEWVLLLVVSTFIAVGLDPVVSWLDARGLRRRYGAPLLVIAIAVATVGFLYLAGSSLVDQADLLGTRIDQVRSEVVKRVPDGVSELLPASSDSRTKVGGYLVRVGQSLMTGVFSLGVALILTMYLLLDGRRTYEWLVAFAPDTQRPRVRQTAVEARQAVLAYVRGNAITSVLAGVCAYVAMQILHVPAALLLALLTAVFDLLPVIGILLSTVPAVMLGLSVSPWVGLAVALYHAAYNIVENYYITPKVYGRELRLSDLAVILALAIGAEIGGVVGALVFLPIAALYPTVERIWLRDRVAPETVQDHRRIENSVER